MRRLAMLAGAAIALAGCDLNLSDIGYCGYSREFSDEISASGLDALIADVGPGDVHVVGRSGSNRVRVHARACARDRGTSEDIDFVLDHTATEARVTSYIPSYGDGRLNLTIEVPEDFDVYVRKYGSGQVDVTDVFGRVEY